MMYECIAYVTFTMVLVAHQCEMHSLASTSYKHHHKGGIHHLHNGMCNSLVKIYNVCYVCNVHQFGGH
uniref:Uncharacterized protein n=1 Tax=Ixodes ricinus TaxID=34613 RepID=A0A0K8RMT7_IXORI